MLQGIVQRLWQKQQKLLSWFHAARVVRTVTCWWQAGVSGGQADARCAPTNLLMYSSDRHNSGNRNRQKVLEKPVLAKITALKLHESLPSHSTNQAYTRQAGVTQPGSII